MLLDQAQLKTAYLFEGLQEPASAAQTQLLHMGLIPGSTIQVLHRAPTGSPLQIRVGATTLSIRIELARSILIREYPRGQ